MPIDKTKLLANLTYTASGQDVRDLLDRMDSEPVTALEFRLAGQVTATGGGAVSGLTLDAPLRLINNLRIDLAHKTLGTFSLWDGQVIDAFHLSNFLNGNYQNLTAPTPGTSASDNFIASFIIPTSFRLRGRDAYLHPDEYSSISMTVDYGPIANYASTNLSAIASTTLDVFARHVLDSTMSPVTPHWAIGYNIARYQAESTDTALQLQSFGGAIFPLMLLRQFDSSGTGNAQRVNGLVRRLRLKQGSRNIADTTWMSLQESTRRVTGLGLTTTMPAGVALLLLGNLDARNRSVRFEVDTSTASQQDVTAITPATGDLFIASAMALRPVNLKI